MSLIIISNQNEREINYSKKTFYHYVHISNSSYLMLRGIENRGI